MMECADDSKCEYKIVCNGNSNSPLLRVNVWESGIQVILLMDSSEYDSRRSYKYCCSDCFREMKRELRESNNLLKYIPSKIVGMKVKL